MIENVRKGYPFIQTACCFFFAIFMGACSTTPISVSQQSLQAAQMNSRGIRAAARGDIQSALDEFRMALKLNAAIEDVDGSITNLLNMARLLRLQGDAQSASEHTQKGLALADGQSPLYGELCFELARLKQGSALYPDAESWVRKALAHSNERQKGKYLNLLARLLMQQDKQNEAETYAIQADEVNRTLEDLQETGYSLRLLGDIELVRGNYATAIDRYEEALHLHKNRGSSIAMADDLEALGRAAELAGEADRAASYYERCETVSRNSGREWSAEKAMSRKNGVRSEILKQE